MNNMTDKGEQRCIFIIATAWSQTVVWTLGHYEAIFCPCEKLLLSQELTALWIWKVLAAIK